MTRAPRKPAALILCASLVLGLAYLALAQRPHSYYALGSATLEELEVAVAAPRPDPQAWLLYGQRLAENHRYPHAAAAYAKYLETSPYDRSALFGRGLALAQAGDADAFYTFVRDLVYSQPKLSVDLLERRECQVYQSQPRFASLYQEARVHAMD